MITTRFLDHDEYSRYGEWMQGLGSDTLAMYYGVPVSEEYIASVVERIIAEPLSHQFLVAESGGEIVGVLHIAVVDSHALEFAISVSESHRRQGIGDRLMRDAIVWARNRLYTRLYLHCLSRNTAIRRLCERHGLTVVNEEGDSDVATRLPLPTFLSLLSEIDHTVSNLIVMSMMSLSKIPQKSA